MGRSTVNELIQRAKSMNSYNNSGIETTTAWLDFMNDALVGMVDQLNIQEEISLSFNPSTRLYDLPEDYYRIVKVTDLNNYEIGPFKDNGINLDGGSTFSTGYLINDKGYKQVIEFPLYDSVNTFTLLYVRYPAKLEIGTINTQKPEVPTLAETSLCFKAVHYACLNNNELQQAEYFENRYRDEVEKVRKAMSRARGV